MSRSASLAEVGILAFLDAPAWVMRRNLGALVAVMLPARLVAVIPSSVGQYLTWGMQPDDNLAGLVIGTVLTYGGVIFSMVLLTGGFAALSRQARACLDGAPLPPGQAWRWAAQPAVFGTSALVALLVLVGSAFCLVPGLFAAMLFALVMPLMAAEGLTGGRALDRSMHLARHGSSQRWFTSTGAWALCLSAAYGLVNYAIGSLVTLPAAVVGGFYGFKAATEGSDFESLMTVLPGSMAVIANIGGAFAYVLADVYLIVACTLLYRRTRDLLEGVDLRAELEALGG